MMSCCLAMAPRVTRHARRMSSIRHVRAQKDMFTESDILKSYEHASSSSTRSTQARQSHEPTAHALLPPRASRVRRVARGAMPSKCAALIRLPHVAHAFSRRKCSVIMKIQRARTGDVCRQPSRPCRQRQRRVSSPMKRACHGDRAPRWLLIHVAFAKRTSV